MEATSRPGIDKVFPTYEVLFNELDRLSEVLEDPTHDDHKWMRAIYPAVIEMKLKLKRYYGMMERPHVYGNSIILNSKWKLTLFHQDSWEEGSVDKYCDQCHIAYMEDYHTYDVQSMCTSFSIGMKYPNRLTRKKTATWNMRIFEKQHHRQKKLHSMNMITISDSLHLYTRC